MDLRVYLLLFSFVCEAFTYGVPDFIWGFGSSNEPTGTTCECEKTHKVSLLRIVGGSETKENEYPFVVRIERNENYVKRSCGGSIITARHILTAAHCTINRDPFIYEVTVAQHSLYIPTQNQETYYVEKVFGHPGYSNLNQANDISILLLKKEIEFNRNVKRVCLPNGPLDIENKKVKVMGWGRVSNEHFHNSINLNHATLKVISFDLCSKFLFGKISQSNPKQLCTFANGKSACSGDSGGPIIWLDPDSNRYTQVSLNSFGRIDYIGDCANSYPRVGTRISSYLDWIKTTINVSAPQPFCTKKKLK